MSGLIEKAKEIISPKNSDNSDIAPSHSATGSTDTRGNEPTTQHANIPPNVSAESKTRSSDVTDSAPLSSGGIRNSVTGAGSRNAPDTTNTLSVVDPTKGSEQESFRDAGIQHGTGVYNTVTGAGSKNETTIAGGRPNSSTHTDVAEPRIDSSLHGPRNAENFGATAASQVDASEEAFSPTSSSNRPNISGVDTSSLIHEGSDPSRSNAPDFTNQAHSHDSERHSAQKTGAASTTTPTTTGTVGAPDNGTLTGSATDLPGPAPNTAGPHKSDLLNKLDPRVDSDRDASKTVGGDKTIP
ncbi:MAG: hypothetical protein M1821_005165 [Bathelium mastoideum]|nr:MAG: hypothetical protein M1821_005165 [Bathelium mastoideum]